MASALQRLQGFSAPYVAMFGRRSPGPLRLFLIVLCSVYNRGGRPTPNTHKKKRAEQKEFKWTQTTPVCINSKVFLTIQIFSACRCARRKELNAIGVSHPVPFCARRYYLGLQWEREPTSGACVSLTLWSQWTAAMASVTGVSMIC